MNSDPHQFFAKGESPLAVLFNNNAFGQKEERFGEKYPNLETKNRLWKKLLNDNGHQALNAAIMQARDNFYELAETLVDVDYALMKSLLRVEKPFIEALNNTPNGFTLYFTRVDYCGAAQRKIVDTEFDRIAKADWLQNIAEDFPEQLLEAGFTEEAIEYLKEEGKLPNTDLTNGKKWSVEHIFPRAYGGNNDDGNLILMETRYNQWAMSLQNANGLGATASNALVLLAEPTYSPQQGCVVFNSAQPAADKASLIEEPTEQPKIKKPMKNSYHHRQHAPKQQRRMGRI
ncbi:MAG: hypothetical protein ACOYK8_01370 [Alphaproteobacteria bacterium]